MATEKKGWLATLMKLIPINCGFAQPPDDDGEPTVPAADVPATLGKELANKVVEEALAEVVDKVVEEAAAAVPAKIFHVVQLSVWKKAQADGVDYFPPTYEQDGFIHATHDGNLLIDVLNHFYKEVRVPFRFDTDALASP